MNRYNDMRSKRVERVMTLTEQSIGNLHAMCNDEFEAFVDAFNASSGELGRKLLVVSKEKANLSK